jgi:hypothetical protein
LGILTTSADRAVFVIVLTALGGCSWDWESRMPSPEDGGFDATPDGPIDSDPCAAHTAALFCDGFESGDLSAWGGAVGNPVEIVETAHSGKYAARGEASGDIPGGTTQSRIAAEWDTPVTTGSIYVRGYFFVPADVVPNQATLFDLSGSGGRIAVVVGSTGTTFLASDLPNAGDDTANSAPDAIERGQWQCLELAVEIGGTGAGSITLSREGVPFANGNRSGVNTVSGDGYTAVRLPVQYTKGPFEALVDDVVVDTSPIGCDN